MYRAKLIDTFYSVSRGQILTLKARGRNENFEFAGGSTLSAVERENSPYFTPSGVPKLLPPSSHDQPETSPENVPGDISRGVI